MHGTAGARRPELLAPGGGLHAAWYAFEAGADAVYVGLTDFSARKGAVNFTLEQLRRLKALAAERGRRVYVTVNTVIREQEIERLAENLVWLELLAVDGIFIQDLGVYLLLREHFPALPIIASTQMAIHSTSGIRRLKQLGFRRVILPRELPLAAIRRLRGENPDIEIEVFIHGALCYSYSGLCLASGLLAGRSGNRGECAQVCRSLYTRLSAEGERRGYFFSCRDLALEEDVLELAEIGVDAFKIEGRLKSPEYVYHTVRYYRRLIDAGGRLAAEEARELRRRRDLGFARQQTRGYFRSPSGARLIDPRFPNHTGILLGRVEEVSRDSFTLRASSELALRDGLAWFPAGEPAGGEPPGGEPPGPVILSVRSLWKGSRAVPVCPAGDTARVGLPAGARPRPLAGQEIWQLSSRQLDLPLPKEAGFRPYRVPLAGTVILGAAQLAVRTVLLGRELRFSRPVGVERAKRSRPLGEILGRLFAESAGCPFVLDPIRMENATGLPDDRIFVPISLLKRVKNEFYRELEELFERLRGERVAAAARGGRPLPGGMGNGPSLPWQELSRRERLSGGRGETPFVGPGEEPDPDRLAVVNGMRFLPLPPVLADEAGAFDRLEALVRRHGEKTFAVGLNNLAHLALVERLNGRPNVRFFLDFFSYVANRYAWRFYAERIPNLLFQYFWIEGTEEDFLALRAGLAERGGGSGAPPALLRVGPGFRAPLFYSLGCYARHNLGQACGAACPGAAAAQALRFPLRQGRNRFTVVVRDCVTCLFREAAR